MFCIHCLGMMLNRRTPSVFNIESLYIRGNEYTVAYHPKAVRLSFDYLTFLVTAQRPRRIDFERYPQMFTDFKERSK